MKLVILSLSLIVANVAFAETRVVSGEALSPYKQAVFRALEGNALSCVDSSGNRDSVGIIPVPISLMVSDANSLTVQSNGAQPVLTFTVASSNRTRQLQVVGNANNTQIVSMELSGSVRGLVNKGNLANPRMEYEWIADERQRIICN